MPKGQPLVESGGGRTVSPDVLYHGTSEEGAKSLVNAGTFSRSSLQRRDEGFFGEGFYVTGDPSHAFDYGGEIVEVHLESSARILVGLEPGKRDSLRPTARQSWHDQFKSWAVGEIRDAWGNGHDPEKLFSAYDPESGDFKRREWYKKVSDWAESAGYDGVKWGSEVVLFDPEAVRDIRPHNMNESRRRHIREGLLDSLFGGGGSSDDGFDARDAAKSVRGRIRDAMRDASDGVRDLLKKAADAVDRFRWSYPAPDAADHLRRADNALADARRAGAAPGTVGPMRSAVDELAAETGTRLERVQEGILDTIGDALGLGDEEGGDTEARIETLADQGREGGTTSPAAEVSDRPLLAYAVGRALEDRSDVSQSTVENAFASAVRMMQQHGLMRHGSFSRTDRGDLVLRGARQEADYAAAQDRYGWALERIRGEAVRGLVGPVRNRLRERAGDVGKTMVALLPPDRVRDRLAPHLGPGVTREDLHMTLHYIGEVPTSRAEEAAAHLRRAAQTMSPVELTPDGPALFTNEDADVRVLLFNGPGIDGIRAGVVGALDGAGLVGEQKHGFVPHVTLGYYDPGAGMGDRGWRDLTREGWEPWVASELCVVQDDEVVERLPMIGANSGRSDLVGEASRLLRRPAIV